MNKTFVRKLQTFGDLTNEPPKTWSALRGILRREIISVRTRIAQLEETFYENQNPIDYLRTIAPIIKEIIIKQRIQEELTTMRQIENALLTSEMETDDKRLSRESTDKLHHFQLKLLTYIPDKFFDLIELCKSLENYCQKYMRAFFNPKVDPTVEAAKQYARKISHWKGDIIGSIQHLYRLPECFLQTGVNLSDLGEEAIDLLERVDLYKCPVVVMFSDCCEHLRKILVILENWIDHDELYVEYIQSDLQSADKTNANSEKDLKTFTHSAAMTQFRLRQVLVEKNSLNVELMSVLGSKEAALIVDEEAAYQDIKTIKADINIKEFQKMEIKRSLHKVPKKKATKQRHEFEGLALIVQELRQKIIKLKKTRTAIQQKLKVIGDKRSELESLCCQAKELEKTLTSIKKKSANALETAETSKQISTKCKEIYSLVSTPDILPKIFYKMPLESSRSVAHKGSSGGTTARGGAVETEEISHMPSPRLDLTQGDELDKVFCVIAQHIGQDWMKLYRKLPFIPPRGNENIDVDLRELAQFGVGGDTIDCTLQSLRRWRRFHRRARVTDLLDGLSDIGRTDIHRPIKRIGHIREKKKVFEEKPFPKDLPEELMLFYREVERFDELHALGRL